VSRGQHGAWLDAAIKLASNVISQILAGPASVLTAGRELRWRKDLHSMRGCRLPIGILRTALPGQLCLMF